MIKILPVIASIGLNDILCDKCYIPLDVIESGGEGHVLFCRPCQRVYCVEVKNRTKLCSPEYIEQCNKYIRVNDIINNPVGIYQNIDEIENLINNK